MDVQSSTAPLLRQLESMERQNRVRAAAWAGLETKLRADLEETVIQNEKLSKECSDLKTNYTRLERMANDRESELKSCKKTMEDQTATIVKLQARLETLETEGQKRQAENPSIENQFKRSQWYRDNNAHHFNTSTNIVVYATGVISKVRLSITDDRISDIS
jgi:chromosome segregation ATPase